MDLDLARQVVRTSLLSSRELHNLLPVLKAGCRPAEYEAYLRAVAAVVAEAGQQLLSPVFAEHPELEAEVDAAIKKQGRY